MPYPTSNESSARDSHHCRWCRTAYIPGTETIVVLPTMTRRTCACGEITSYTVHAEHLQNRPPEGAPTGPRAMRAVRNTTFGSAASNAATAHPSKRLPEPSRAPALRKVASTPVNPRMSAFTPASMTDQMARAPATSNESATSSTTVVQSWRRASEASSTSSARGSRSGAVVLPPSPAASAQAGSSPETATPSTSSSPAPSARGTMPGSEAFPPQHPTAFTMAATSHSMDLPTPSTMAATSHPMNLPTPSATPQPTALAMHARNASRAHAGAPVEIARWKFRDHWHVGQGAAAVGARPAGRGVRTGGARPAGQSVRTGGAEQSVSPDVSSAALFTNNSTLYDPFLGRTYTYLAPLSVHLRDLANANARMVRELHRPNGEGQSWASTVGCQRRVRSSWIYTWEETDPPIVFPPRQD